MKHKAVGTPSRQYSCAASLIADMDEASVLESQPLFYETRQAFTKPQSSLILIRSKGTRKKRRKEQIMGNDSEIKGREVKITGPDTH